MLAAQLSQAAHACRQEAVLFKSRPVAICQIPVNGSALADQPAGAKRFSGYCWCASEASSTCCGPNPVAEALGLLGLDSKRFGSPEWNPLGDLIQPGDHVVLKPNLIREAHAQRPNEWEQVITHPAVIQAVLQYVALALKGSGRVTIAEGPQTDSDFEAICSRIGLLQVVQRMQRQGMDIALVDLRNERWLQKGGITCRRLKLPGDPAGTMTIRLDGASAFSDYRLSGRFYGADYDMEDTCRYHHGENHAYVLCRTAMDADVLINLPKMKTHKKTGVTLGLKNMVGVNGYRNCLPHHTLGAPEQGGDEFPKDSLKNRTQSESIATFKRILAACGGVGGALSRLVVRVGRVAYGDTSQVIRSGNWHGNDTAWRMVLDLNRALFHFDGTGVQRASPLRTMTIVDGIVAGEGDGPVHVDAKQSGLIVAGFNPLAVDTACAVVMGFDYRKIPMLARGWGLSTLHLAEFGPEEIQCRSNVPGWNGSLSALEQSDHLGFRPPFGWIGHIERFAAD